MSVEDCDVRWKHLGSEEIVEERLSSEQQKEEETKETKERQ